MNEKILNASILDTFPAVDEEKIDALLKDELDQSDVKLVVLDDDPTGVQTVHDISVYTGWDPESILEGFEEEGRLFYVLTNSRGMTADQSEKAHREMARNIAAAAKKTGKDYLIMSRSDSTLRGHYPLEPQVLREEMEKDGFVIDGEVLCPFFKEGGRFTIGDVHYVLQGEDLIPAAQTEFAQDKTFGYTHSSIPEYIEEKTDGAYPAKDVISVPLDMIRAGRVDEITDLLLQAKDFQKIVVNAIDYSDIKTFATALYRAMKQGRHYMFRTAAGLVKVMGGVSNQPLLTREQMVPSEIDGGGMVVVGSHTKKTTEQLEELLTLDVCEPIPFDSSKVLEGEAAFDAEIARCVAEAEKVMKDGKCAVLYTGRELISLPDDTKESALLRSVKIADGVQRLVADLSITPAYIVAKGGITSSDIGTKALAVRRADVLGQIRPGIPVWKTGAESRFPGIPYVIFPGNVGSRDTLREAVEILEKR